MSLPCNVDAERFVLGSILLDGTLFPVVAGTLSADDFSLDTHQRIYRGIAAAADAGNVDYMTTASALMAAGEMENVGGLTYLVSLTDGLPQLPNVDDYVRLVREKATLRRIMAAAQRLGIEAAQRDADPAELLARANADLLTLAERAQDSALLCPSEIIAREGGIGRYLDRRTRKSGVSSGYPSLDVLCGGFAPGAMYVIGARPRMGKTAWVLNVAERVSVDAPHRSLIFSLEMGDVSLLDRLVCSRARVNLKKFTGGWLNEDERKRVARSAGEIAADDRIRIDQKANTTISEIHAAIRKEKARVGVDLVIIDYLQLLLAGKDEFRVNEMSRISRNCKVMAKDCGVPVIALCQLNRAVDARQDHRPCLSDLRESGAIEQDADLVGFLYREDVYRKPEDPKDGLAELIVAKQRDGPEGVVPLVFQGEYVRFEEREEMHG